VPPTQKAACDDLAALVSEMERLAALLQPEQVVAGHRAGLLIGMLEMAHELGGRWPLKKQGGI
jgi:hypothetical protein